MLFWEYEKLLAIFRRRKKKNLSSAEMIVSDRHFQDWVSLSLWFHEKSEWAGISADCTDVPIWVHFREDSYEDFRNPSLHNNVALRKTSSHRLDHTLVRVALTRRIILDFMLLFITKAFYMLTPFTFVLQNTNFGVFIGLKAHHVYSSQIQYRIWGVTFSMIFRHNYFW